jgi:hypothetical protein
MNQPRLSGECVAQAVYMWSRTLVDGSVGMGFCAISPSLEGSIDWLGRLDPAELGLFQGDVTGASSELYEARKGFSEVGRMLVGDVAIVYRKTADGEVSRAGSRPHPVLHALIAESTTLGFSFVTRVRDDFWIRRVESSGGGGLGLTDLALADVLDEQDASTGHSCPADHEGAQDILRAVAAQGLEHECTIELPGGDRALAVVALAFPGDVANGFSLIPYVAIGGVRRELVLRVPTHARTVEEPRRRSAVEGPAVSGPDECTLERAVGQAASQFLYGAKPSLSRYAEAALKLSMVPTGGIAPPQFQRVAGSAAPGLPARGPDINPVYPLLEEVRGDAGPLTDVASKALLSKLLASGISAAQVLELPQGTLAEMFSKVGNGEVVWEWSRRLFADVGAETFIDLWNRTRVGVFLGIVLMKNLSAADGEGLKISAEKGVTPEATAEILRSMRRYEDGGRSIGRIIERGFGDTESMRKFIAETFSEYPRFLFDAILANTEIPAGHMGDYIRSCYQPWATHRRLPERESAAIYQALRLTIMQRLKVVIGR